MEFHEVTREESDTGTLNGRPHRVGVENVSSQVECRHAVVVDGSSREEPAGAPPVGDRMDFYEREVLTGEGWNPVDRVGTGLEMGIRDGILEVRDPVRHEEDLLELAAIEVRVFIDTGLDDLLENELLQGELRLRRVGLVLERQCEDVLRDREHDPGKRDVKCVVHMGYTSGCRLSCR